MHPEIGRRLAEQHHADLLRSAARARQAKAQRGNRSWRDWSWRATAQRWLRGPGRPRLSGGAATRAPRPAQQPGVFLSGTEAYGFRVYLTPAEARKLTRDCSRLLDRYADRVDDPGRRPAGAVPVELVVLSRRLPEPAGAGRGLPGAS